MRQHYGYCPHCGADVVGRTRGGTEAKDTCAAGHVYRSAFTLPTVELRAWAKEVQHTLEFLRDTFEMRSVNGGGFSPRDLAEMRERCRRTLEAIPVQAHTGEPD